MDESMSPLESTTLDEDSSQNDPRARRSNAELAPIARLSELEDFAAAEWTDERTRCSGRRRGNGVKRCSVTSSASVAATADSDKPPMPTKFSLADCGNAVTDAKLTQHCGELTHRSFKNALPETSRVTKASGKQADDGRAEVSARPSQQPRSSVVLMGSERSSEVAEKTSDAGVIGVQRRTPHALFRVRQIFLSGRRQSDPSFTSFLTRESAINGSIKSNSQRNLLAPDVSPQQPTYVSEKPQLTPGILPNVPSHPAKVSSAPDKTREKPPLHTAQRRSQENVDEIRGNLSSRPKSAVSRECKSQHRITRFRWKSTRNLTPEKSHSADLESTKHEKQRQFATNRRSSFSDLRDLGSSITSQLSRSLNSLLEMRSVIPEDRRLRDVTTMQRISRYRHNQLIVCAAEPDWQHVYDHLWQGHLYREMTSPHELDVRLYDAVKRLLEVKRKRKQLGVTLHLGMEVTGLIVDEQHVARISGLAECPTEGEVRRRLVPNFSELKSSCEVKRVRFQSGRSAETGGERFVLEISRTFP